MPEDITFVSGAAESVLAPGPLSTFVRSPRAIEAALLCLILCGLAWCLLFLIRNGYLPPPFFYYVEDTFMDWFNTAYLANRGHPYDIGGTLYPPLSFLVLKSLSLNSCYSRDAFLARDCDWLGLASICALFALNAVFSFACFRERDRNTSLIRAVSITCGFPMLLALESGNLILLTYTCLLLAFGNLTRAAWARWIALGLAINLKPYLLVALAPQVIQRRWSWIEGCAVTILVIYLVSFLFIGSGTPGQILLNQIIWSIAKSQNSFMGVELMSSYSSLFDYVARAVIVRQTIGAGTIGVTVLILRTLVLGAQIGTLIALSLVAIRRIPTPDHRLAALAICLLLTTIGIGVYTDILVIFLIFLERWRRPPIIVAIVAAYLLCLPVDFIWIHLGERIRVSYLGGRSVHIPVGLTLGALVRPGLLLVVQYALIVATLQDVWHAGVGARDKSDSAAVTPQACEPAR